MCVCNVVSSPSPVSRLRPILGRVKRSRDDTWLDDDDDDDDDSVPVSVRARLDLLQEDDEAVAGGDNFPGLRLLLSLFILLFMSRCWQWKHSW